MKKKFVLIDSHALIHRAFHALPPLNTQQGELVNAVFGFFSILFSALKDLKPDYVVAAFDLAKPTFRHQQFSEYKANRVKAPDELYGQIGRVKEGLTALNIPIFEKEGFEADDILGTVTKKLENEKDIEVFIVTGDLDTLQLVGPKIKIFTPKRGIKDTQIYNEVAIKERFGLSPKQMADFKGLKGDPSDNIPGVPGVGDKTASSLLQEFGSLDNLYKKIETSNLPEKLKQKLIENKEQAFFSRQLAQIHKDVPISFSLKEALWEDFKADKAKGFLESLKFFSLIKRLNEISKKEIVSSQERIGFGENVKSTIIQIEELYNQGLISEKIKKTELALAPILRQMEKIGMLLDIERLKILSKKISQEIEKLEKKILKLAGQNFNINSPQQLSEILFEVLKIKKDGLKKTPGKVISTATPELTKIIKEHEIVKSIIKFRELAKLRSTYVDALPKLIDKNNRLHTTFDQFGTTTGRLSSKNPNLQNIPTKTKLGNEIRKAFVAPRGYCLLSADYSQIELRVVASLAKDKEMLKLLKSGADIHTLTAASVFAVGTDKVTAKMRKAAKVLNFGMIYGMSITGFAQAAGVEKKEAKEFIQKYFETFKGVSSYIEKTKEKAQKEGSVQSLFGRKRIIAEINSKAWNLRAAAQRMAVNMPVQGTAADIIKMAMVELQEKILKDKLDGRIRMVVQVHDELVFEVERGFLDQAKKIIKLEMEKIEGLEVPLRVDIKTGKNWGQMS